MQVVIGLGLTIVALALLWEMTLLINLFIHFFFKFEKPDMVYIVG